MPPVTNTCLNCKYFVPFVQIEYGVCHRYAPRPVMPRGDEPDNHPAIMQSDYWCGDWVKSTTPLIGETFLKRTEKKIKLCLQKLKLSKKKI